MNLYELAREYQQADAQLDDVLQDGRDEALADSLVSLLSHIEVEASFKIANVVRWLLNEKARAEALKAEESRLRDKRKAAEAKAESLKKFLREFMIATGMETADAGVAKLFFRAGSTSLEVDERQVPNWPAEVFDKAIETGAVEEVYKTNKTKIKELPNYLELPGVKEVTGEKALVIR